jgi:hypothetical protein
LERAYCTRLRSIATPSSLTPAIGAIFATRTLTHERGEFSEQHVGNRLRETLEELVRVIGGERLQALHHRGIVERVGEIAGLKHVVGMQPDVHVEPDSFARAFASHS